VEIDDFLFRTIPIANDAERLQFETGRRQFLHPGFGSGVIRKCRDERFRVFRCASCSEGSPGGRARFASRASGSDANRAALDRAFQARRTARKTISPCGSHSGRLGNYSDANANYHHVDRRPLVGVEIVIVARGLQRTNAPEYFPTLSSSAAKARNTGYWRCFPRTHVAVEFILVGGGQPRALSPFIRPPHRRNSGENHV